MSLKEKVEAQRQRCRLEFEKHRGFLAQEEQLQLRRLEQEEQTTLQRLRDSKNRLAQHSRALRELADELEDRCQRSALGLLEVRPRGQMGALTHQPLGPECSLGKALPELAGKAAGSEGC